MRLVLAAVPALAACALPGNWILGGNLCTSEVGYGRRVQKFTRVE